MKNNKSNRKEKTIVNDLYDLQKSTVVTMTLARQILEVFDTEKSRIALDYIQTKAYDKLVNLSYDPDMDQADDLYVVNLLKKYPFKHPNLNPEASAIDSFIDAENQCRAVNNLIENGWFTANGLIMEASNVISDILGEFSLEALKELSKPGKHAAVNARGNNAHLLNHFEQMSCHKDSKLLTSILYDTPSMRGLDIDYVDCSEVEFVPKNAKTLRSICIEPSINLYFQLGLGSMIARKLKRVGIDLKDQSRNQRGALEGSLSNNAATIDLSAASDSISLLLVNELLPRDWMAAIEMCRCPTMRTPDGAVVEVEKVSSMGNGFTFPLEALIFYAFTKVGCRRAKAHGPIMVYGDDIICPSSGYDQVVKCLNAVGFTINQEKSYSTGAYRESCGLHAINGQIHRPIKIDMPLRKATDIFRLANSIMATALERGDGSYIDLRWRRVYKACIDLLPKALRQITVPLLTDPTSIFQIPIINGALMDPFVLKKYENGFDGSCYTVFTGKPRKIKRLHFNANKRMLLWSIAQKRLEGWLVPSRYSDWTDDIKNVCHHHTIAILDDGRILNRYSTLLKPTSYNRDPGQYVTASTFPIRTRHMQYGLQKVFIANSHFLQVNWG